MAQAYVDSITKIKDATKYKYSNGHIIYRLLSSKIEIRADKINFKNHYLHPSDPQSTIDLLYGQLSEQYGTSTPEEYVEYLIENGILFSGGASEVISYPEAKKMQVVGDISYFGFAEPGTLESAALWKAMKLDETIVGDLELKITWADNGNYTQVATDLTSLTYS